MDVISIFLCYLDNSQLILRALGGFNNSDEQRCAARVLSKMTQLSAMYLHFNMRIQPWRKDGQVFECQAGPSTPLRSLPG